VGPVTRRLLAIAALVNIGDGSAVEPLIEMLSDELIFICHSAAITLGKIGDTRAVAPLCRLLSHKAKEMRKDAASSPWRDKRCQSGRTSNSNSKG
jgi:HEAT repeat protein